MQFERGSGTNFRYRKVDEEVVGAALRDLSFSRKLQVDCGLSQKMARCSKTA